MKAVNLILTLLVSVVLFNCNSGTSPDTEPPVSSVSFADLEIGQEWLYAEWEKRYSGERMFTGDTTSVSVIAREAGIITFYESPVHVDSISSWDSTTFKFQLEDSVLRQVGINRSRVFGFVGNHDGILTLAQIDSNHVTIDIDTSLYLIREQIGKSRFVGYSDTVELFSDTCEDVIVYYDETPTYVDGFGHLAIFSREEGMEATIYFGGFSAIEQYGYKLVK
ncbi:MAG: hypothetical protein ACE5H0_10390 [Bacteroidota bacterium]